MLTKTFNWFSNKKLREKLIISIAIIIIIPLIVIGAVLSIYMTKMIRNNLCADRIESITGSGANLEQYFGRVEEISVEAGESNSAARIMKSNAFLTDFVTTKQWMESLLKNNTDYENISLSDGKEIYMQMGTYIEGEDEKAVKQLVEDEIETVWTLPRRLEVSPYVITPVYEKPVLTCYSKISEYYNWEQKKAIISVSISEERLCERYIDYLGSDYLECSLVRSDGRILSSTEKEQLGKIYDNHEQIQENIKNEKSGYWKYDGNYYFYSWHEPVQFYLVETIPASTIELSLQPIWIIIACALILCIVFGAVFGYVQHQYMIMPLNQLLNNIQRVQAGDFEIEPQQFNGDEIGRLNQEFQEMSRQLEKMLKEVYISKINEQEAEIQVLMSQINPHFLYNTLDSIHWKAMKCRAYDVADQIEALSEMYKYILSKGRKMITLGEELVFLENYFFIMKARYGKRVEFSVSVDGSCGKTEIPKLILQPLIENSVLHGLEPSDSGGCIWITVFMQEGDLVISVRDNGKGTDGSALMKKVRDQEKDGEALALKNIDMRMRIHYGEDYGIEIISEPEKGCEVILKIPCNLEEERRLGHEDDNR